MTVQVSSAEVIWPTRAFAAGSCPARSAERASTGTIALVSAPPRTSSYSRLGTWFAVTYAVPRQLAPTVCENTSVRTRPRTRDKIVRLATTAAPRAMAGPRRWPRPGSAGSWPEWAVGRAESAGPPGGVRAFPGRHAQLLIAWHARPPSSYAVGGGIRIQLETGSTYVDPNPISRPGVVIIGVDSRQKDTRQRGRFARSPVRVAALWTSELYLCRVLAGSLGGSQAKAWPACWRARARLFRVAWVLASSVPSSRSQVARVCSNSGMASSARPASR